MFTNIKPSRFWPLNHTKSYQYTCILSPWTYLVLSNGSARYSLLTIGLGLYCWIQNGYVIHDPSRNQTEENMIHSFPFCADWKHSQPPVTIIKKINPYSACMTIFKYINMRFKKWDIQLKQRMRKDKRIPPQGFPLSRSV